MFIEALFLKDKNGNKPKVHQQENGQKFVCIQTVELLLRNKKEQTTNTQECGCISKTC